MEIKGAVIAFIIAILIAILIIVVIVQGQIVPTLEKSTSLFGF
jgi:hypothetical protein